MNGNNAHLTHFPLKLYLSFKKTMTSVVPTKTWGGEQCVCILFTSYIFPLYIYIYIYIKENNASTVKY